VADLLANASMRRLPPGWRFAWSAEQHRYYFFHEASYQSTWVWPVEDTVDHPAHHHPPQSAPTFTSTIAWNAARIASLNPVQFARWAEALPRAPCLRCVRCIEQSPPGISFPSLV
jgi:hypothetical protein